MVGGVLSVEGVELDLPKEPVGAYAVVKAIREITEIPHDLLEALLVSLTFKYGSSGDACQTGRRHLEPFPVFLQHFKVDPGEPIKAFLV